MGKKRVSGSASARQVQPALPSQGSRQPVQRMVRRVIGVPDATGRYVPTKEDLVPGEVCGLLAVTPAYIKKGWEITHVPTGYRVAGGYKSKAKARKVCQLLAAIDCWDFKRPSQAKRIPEKTKEAIKEMARA